MSMSCEKMHDLAFNLVRHSFPYNADLVPANGIYCLFEKRESGHGRDRIVRVGTHTGTDRLKSRLKEHFIVENKDRSIFRKNIGRSILAREGDSYLDVWNLDLTTRKAKQLFAHKLDQQRQNLIESRVSKYIQEHFSFVVIPVRDKNLRMTLESKIISTVSLCSACLPSGDWLGNHSPKPRIRESGMWLEQGLYGEPLSPDDIAILNSELS